MTAPSITSAAVQRELAGKRDDWRGIVFGILLVGSLIATLSVLLLILTSQLVQGWPVYATRGLDFITSPLSSDPANATRTRAEADASPLRCPDPDAEARMIAATCGG